jgi:hypothetical protein
LADSQKDPVTRRLQYRAVVKRHLRAEANPLTLEERLTLANRFAAEDRRMALRRLVAKDLRGCRKLMTNAAEFSKIARTLRA